LKEVHCTHVHERYLILLNQETPVACVPNKIAIQLKHYVQCTYNVHTTADIVNQLTYTIVN